MNSAVHTMSDVKDEQLLKKIAKGNSAALEELYNRYSQRLLNYLLHMLRGDADRSQDLLQDVFIQVIDKAALFRSHYKASTWLFTIAGNRCKNEFRKQRRQAAESIADLDGQTALNDWQPSESENGIDGKNFRQAVIRKLYRYDREQRAVFLLRFQQELSVKEIAQIMHCAEGTVKSRLHYTSKKLASELGAFNPRQQKEKIDEKK